jgi:hypothetical protein
MRRSERVMRQAASQHADHLGILLPGRLGATLRVTHISATYYALDRLGTL